MQDEREHLVTSFKGKLERIGAKFKGTLFLTNLRFAGNGKLKQIPLNKGGTLAGMALGGLLGYSIAAIFIEDGKKKGETLRNVFEKEMINKFSKEALSKFDYNFPIIKAYNINKSIRNLSYFINLNYRNEYGLKTIGFIVTPLQEKGETKNDFYTRRIETLDRIEETLIKTQSLDDFESAKKHDQLFLMRISKEIDDFGTEIFNKICAHCKEKNNFKELEGNIFQCLKCGADHYIRD
ncbi:hypothetical protein ES705_06846 [subsurface metagenome]